MEKKKPPVIVKVTLNGDEIEPYEVDKSKGLFRIRFFGNYERNK